MNQAILRTGYEMSDSLSWSESKSISESCSLLGYMSNYYAFNCIINIFLN